MQAPGIASLPSRMTPDLAFCRYYPLWRERYINPDTRTGIDPNEWSEYPLNIRLRVNICFLIFKRLHLSFGTIPRFVKLLRHILENKTRLHQPTHRQIIPKNILFTGNLVNRSLSTPARPNQPAVSRLEDRHLAPPGAAFGIQGPAAA